MPQSALSIYIVISIWPLYLGPGNMLLFIDLLQIWVSWLSMPLSAWCVSGGNTLSEISLFQRVLPCMVCTCAAFLVMWLWLCKQVDLIELSCISLVPSQAALASYPARPAFPYLSSYTWKIQTFCFIMWSIDDVTCTHCLHLLAYTIICTMYSKVSK